jgi:hypothetical protein
MLFHHNNVDHLGVLECQEAEATRATSGTIPHNGTLHDLSKLREIVPQGLYGALVIVFGEDVIKCGAYHLSSPSSSHQ